MPTSLSPIPAAHSRPALSLLLAVCALGPGVLAQAVITADSTIGELARLARDPKTDAVTRAIALDELIDRGVEGAEVAGKILSREGTKELQAYQKAERSILARFERASRSLVHERTARAQTEIDELRRKVLSTTRRSDLTKEMIESVSDPAVERLREIMTTTSNEVLVNEPSLVADVLAAERLTDRISVLRDTFLRAAEVAVDADGPTRTFARFATPADGDALRHSLHERLAELALLATPMSSRDARVFQDNAAQFDQLETLEESRGVRACNEIRVLLGLNALRLDLKLSIAARGHSEDMLRLNFFAHESPVDGKRTPSDRAARAGTSGGAENIAMGHASGRSAIRGWWYSPGHHRNMLGNHGRIGLGQAKTYWTQMFGG